jgi:hypothetical protein
MRSLLSWIVTACLFPIGPAAALTGERSTGPVDNRNSHAEADAFDYFQNSWNLIGLKNYNNGTRVTPANELVLAGGKKLQVRFGRELVALSRRQTKLAMDGYLPVYLLQADDGPVRYEFTLWATPLPTVKDWRKAFDWPAEGENFLNWILVKATNTGTQPAQAKVTAEMLGNSDGATTVVEKADQSLAPGAIAEIAIRVPFEPVANAATWAKEDPHVWLTRTAEYWRDLLRQGAQFDVPCRKATDAWRASLIQQLIVLDHGKIKGGEGYMYDRFYIRDGAYQLMELEEAGQMETARMAVEDFLRWQYPLPKDVEASLPYKELDSGPVAPEGRFGSQGGEYDGNGQGPWTLWQYYQITGDENWLRRVYPAMLRAAQWTMRARRVAPADSPFAGLLPPSWADGESIATPWSKGENNSPPQKCHIVGYDLWNLRGILCTAAAAAKLGKKAEAEQLLHEARLYRKDIEHARKRAGVSYFPPTWEQKGMNWSNTETLWPTELFSPDDPSVLATIHDARTQYRNGGGGFVEGMIRRDEPALAHEPGGPDAILPYMSAYTTMASLIRGQDEQVVEDFYWYLLHSTASQAFAEGIFYKKCFAWADTIPHVTGSANYAIMLRHMLIHEQGDELHLLLAAPDWWLGDGQTISIQRAPTHFGTMNLTIRGTASGVQVELAPPRRQPPKRIVLHLPQSRPLIGVLPGVDDVTRPDQKKRWDFPTVVALYRQQAPKGARPWEAAQDR